MHDKNIKWKPLTFNEKDKALIAKMTFLNPWTISYKDRLQISICLKKQTKLGNRCLLFTAKLPAQTSKIEQDIITSLVVSAITMTIMLTIFHIMKPTQLPFVDLLMITHMVAVDVDLPGAVIVFN